MNKAEDIRAIIVEAVQAGRVSAGHTAKDAFKATERRLYALPTLLQKQAEDKDKLEEFLKYGPKERSKSITRFIKTGVRLTPEEIWEAVLTDMQATIAADEHEINTMERALEVIQDDAYYQTVVGRYIDNLPDEDVAKLIPCDTSTVWRNRKRLVQRLAVWLYGADAEVQIERNVQLLLARMRTTEDKDARRTMLEHFLNEDFHFGSIDTDEVLLHLEGHTDELAALLGNSEDDVFTDLEAERDSLIDRVEQEHPEFVEHVRERRDHFDHDFRANHPTSAARIEARRTQLHARIEHERAERSARRAQHQAELSERHEQHMAAHQERHEQHATEQQLRHEQQLEARLRRQAEKQVAREQRQAAELARKAQHAAEKAQRHAQHAAERAQRQADHLAEKAQRHADHADERAQRHTERADARGHREDDRD